VAAGAASIGEESGVTPTTRMPSWNPVVMAVVDSAQSNVRYRTNIAFVLVIESVTRGDFQNSLCDSHTIPEEATAIAVGRNRPRCCWSRPSATGEPNDELKPMTTTCLRLARTATAMDSWRGTKARDPPEYPDRTLPESLSQLTRGITGDPSTLTRSRSRR